MENYSGLPGLNTAEGQYNDQNRNNPNNNMSYGEFNSYLRNKYATTPYQRSKQRGYGNVFEDVDLGEGFGESRFDKRFRSKYDLEHLENLRGSEQSGAGQILNGTFKMAVTAGTTFLSGWSTLLIGIPSALFEWDFSKLWNNEMNQAINGINKWSEKFAPNYYTDDERELPWYKQLLTANGIGNEVIKNAGFTVGALWGGGAFGKIVGGVAKAAQMGSRITKLGTKLAGAESALAKAGQSITKVAPKMNSIITGSLGVGFGAAGEASIEALNNTDNVVTEWGQAADSEHRDRLAEIEDEFGIDWSMVDPDNLKMTPQLAAYFDAVEQENQRYELEKQRIARDATKFGNTNFATNFALLALTEGVPFFKTFARGYDTSRRAFGNTIKRVLGENGELLGVEASKGYIGKGLLKGARNAAFEGFQEGSQGVLANIGTVRYTNDLKQFMEGMYDDASMETLADWGTSITEGLRESSQDGQLFKEMVIGALTGAGSHLAIANAKNADIQLFGGKIGLSGGFAGEIANARQEYLRDQDIVDRCNKALNSEKKQTMYEYITHMDNMDKAMQERAKMGDRKGYNDAEAQQTVANIGALHAAGVLDLFLEQYSQMFADDQLTAEVVQMVRQTDADEARKLPKNPDGTSQDGLFTNLTDEQIVESIKRKRDSFVKNAKSFTDLMNEIDSYSGGILSYDQLSKLAWIGTTITDVGDRITSILDKDLFGKADSLYETVQQLTAKIESIANTYRDGGDTAKYNKTVEVVNKLREVSQKLNNTSTITSTLRKIKDESSLNAKGKMQRITATALGISNEINEIGKAIDDINHFIEKSYGVLGNDLVESYLGAVEEYVPAMNDVVQLANDMNEYTSKFVEYIVNPEIYGKDVRAAKQNSDKKQKNRRKQRAQQRADNEFNNSTPEQQAAAAQQMDEETLNRNAGNGNAVAIQEKRKRIFSPIVDREAKRMNITDAQLIDDVKQAIVNDKVDEFAQNMQNSGDTKRMNESLSLLEAVATSMKDSADLVSTLKRYVKEPQNVQTGAESKDDNCLELPDIEVVVTQTEPEATNPNVLQNGQEASESFDYSEDGQQTPGNIRPSIARYDLTLKRASHGYNLVESWEALMTRTLAQSGVSEEDIKKRIEALKNEFEQRKRENPNDPSKWYTMPTDETMSAGDNYRGTFDVYMFLKESGAFDYIDKHGAEVVGKELYIVTTEEFGKDCLFLAIHDNDGNTQILGTVKRQGQEAAVDALRGWFGKQRESGLASFTKQNNPNVKGTIDYEAKTQMKIGENDLRDGSIKHTSENHNLKDIVAASGEKDVVFGFVDNKGNIVTRGGIRVNLHPAMQGGFKRNQQGLIIPGQIVMLTKAVSGNYRIAIPVFSKTISTSNAAEAISLLSTGDGYYAKAMSKLYNALNRPMTFSDAWKWVRQLNSLMYFEAAQHSDIQSAMPVHINLCHKNADGANRQFMPGENEEMAVSGIDITFSFINKDGEQDRWNQFINLEEVSNVGEFVSKLVNQLELSHGHLMLKHLDFGFDVNSGSNNADIINSGMFEADVETLDLRGSWFETPIVVEGVDTAKPRNPKMPKQTFEAQGDSSEPVVNSYSVNGSNATIVKIPQGLNPSFSIDVSLKNDDSTSSSKVDVYLFNGKAVLNINGEYVGVDDEKLVEQLFAYGQSQRACAGINNTLSMLSDAFADDKGEIRRTHNCYTDNNGIKFVRMHSLKEKESFAKQTPKEISGDAANRGNIFDGIAREIFASSFRHSNEDEINAFVDKLYDEQDSVSYVKYVEDGVEKWKPQSLRQAIQNASTQQEKDELSKAMLSKEQIKNTYLALKQMFGQNPKRYEYFSKQTILSSALSTSNGSIIRVAGEADLMIYDRVSNTIHIFDFKRSDYSPQNNEFYKAQLMLYKRMLENVLHANNVNVNVNASGWIAMSKDGNSIKLVVAKNNSSYSQVEQFEPSSDNTGLEYDGNQSMYDGITEESKDLTIDSSLQNQIDNDESGEVTVVRVGNNQGQQVADTQQGNIEEPAGEVHIENGEDLAGLLDGERQGNDESSGEGFIGNEINFDDEYVDDEDPNEDIELPRSIDRAKDKSQQIDIEVESKWLAKALPNVSHAERLQWVDDLIYLAKSDKRAFGKYYRGIMMVAKNGVYGTLFHEGFHLVFDALFTDEERISMLEAARDRYGDLSRIDLEERLAEEFANYTIKEEYCGIVGKVRKFFRRLSNHRTVATTNPRYIESMFYKINNGYFADRQVAPRDHSVARYSKQNDKLSKLLKAAKLQSDKLGGNSVYVQGTMRDQLYRAAKKLGYKISLNIRDNGDYTSSIREIYIDGVPTIASRLNNVSSPEMRAYNKPAQSATRQSSARSSITGAGIQLSLFDELPSMTRAKLEDVKNEFDKLPPQIRERILDCA